MGKSDIQLKLTNGHGNGQASVAYVRSKAEMLVATAGADGKVCVRDTTLLETLHRAKCEMPPARIIAADPKGKLLAVGDDEYVKVGRGRTSPHGLRTAASNLPPSLPAHKPQPHCPRHLLQQAHAASPCSPAANTVCTPLPSPSPSHAPPHSCPRPPTPFPHRTLHPPLHPHAVL